jgi:hypothetical protein
MPDNARRDFLRLTAAASLTATKGRLLGGGATGKGKT